MQQRGRADASAPRQARPMRRASAPVDGLSSPPRKTTTTGGPGHHFPSELVKIPDEAAAPSAVFGGCVPRTPTDNEQEAMVSAVKIPTLAKNARERPINTCGLACADQGQPAKGREKWGARLLRSIKAQFCDSSHRPDPSADWRHEGSSLHRGVPKLAEMAAGPG